MKSIPSKWIWATIVKFRKLSRQEFIEIRNIVWPYNRSSMCWSNFVLEWLVPAFHSYLMGFWGQLTSFSIHWVSVGIRIDLFLKKIGAVWIGSCYTPSHRIGPSNRNQWKAWVCSSKQNFFLVLILECQMVNRPERRQVVGQVRVTW